MEIRLEQIVEGKDEIIVRYKEMTNELSSILSLIRNQEKKIIGLLNEEKYLLSPEEIYYVESVDNIVFIYTYDEVYRTFYSLNELENQYSKKGFFRCNKSAIINVYQIASLRSEVGNRIDATLNNGEHIIISRRYSKELRALLMNDRKHGGYR
jgi:DNA-binding LytR/AlgR family response regulator